MIFDNPKNYIPRIESIWAIVSVDPVDGNEGVVAAPLQAGMLSVPLIAADKARLDSILPLARAIAGASGTKLKLVRFHAREEIEVIEP